MQCVVIQIGWTFPLKYTFKSHSHVAWASSKNKAVGEATAQHPRIQGLSLGGRRMRAATAPAMGSRRLQIKWQQGHEVVQNVRPVTKSHILETQQWFFLNCVP